MLFWFFSLLIISMILLSTLASDGLDSILSSLFDKF